jgi:hypothetical protein
MMVTYNMVTVVGGLGGGRLLSVFGEFDELLMSCEFANWMVFDDDVIDDMSLFVRLQKREMTQ